MTVLQAIKTEQQKANESTVSILRELLTEAEAGKIETVLAIAFHPDGDYVVRGSECLGTTKKIGALERIKYAYLGDPE